MSTHCIHYYDEELDGQLIDMNDESWHCTSSCMCDTLNEIGVDTSHEEFDLNDESKKHLVSWGYWPGGQETESDVYCATCGELMWRGLEWYETPTYPRDKTIQTLQALYNFCAHFHGGQASRLYRLLCRTGNALKRRHADNRLDQELTPYQADIYSQLEDSYA